MPSVTQIIKKIKQPRGGFINKESSEIIFFDDKKELLSSTNIHPSIKGLVVDYLSRYILFKDKNDAFKISLEGASIIGKRKLANNLLSKIKGLDDKSIKNACKLCGFDVCKRANPLMYLDVDNINPNKDDIYNIKLLVERTINFFNKFGPVIKNSCNFPGGYTSNISSGDFDFLTENCIWDLKTSINEPISQNFLQTYIYCLLGEHSVNKQLQNINKFGIFNPILNKCYIVYIKDIPNEIRDILLFDIIGYKKNEIINKKISKYLDMTNREIEQLTDIYSKNNIFNVGDLCKLLKINDNKIRLLLKKGDIVSFKQSNRYYTYKEDFEDYLKKENPRLLLFLMYEDSLLQLKYNKNSLNICKIGMILTTFFIFLYFIIICSISVIL